MTCPRCGLMIAGLACPACTALQSRAAIFEMQGSHLPSVRAGRLNFYAKRLSSKHPWHLMLFGDKAHGLCGVEIQAVGPHNRSDILYAKLDDHARAKALCAACLHALRAIEERDALREES